MNYINLDKIYKKKEDFSMDEIKLLQFRKHVSYIFQRGGIFDFMNVEENDEDQKWTP